MFASQIKNEKEDHMNLLSIEDASENIYIFLFCYEIRMVRQTLATIETISQSERGVSAHDKRADCKVLRLRSPTETIARSTPRNPETEMQSRGE